MLSSRFTALSLTQSTLLISTQLQELLMTGTNLLEWGSPSQRSFATLATTDLSFPPIRSYQAGRRCGPDLRSSLIEFSRQSLRKRQRRTCEELLRRKIHFLLAKKKNFTKKKKKKKKKKK